MNTPQFWLMVFCLAVNIVITYFIPGIPERKAIFVAGFFGVAIGLVASAFLQTKPPTKGSAGRDGNKEETK